MRRVVPIVVLAALAASPASASARVAVSCPFAGGTNGDHVSRGFYVSGYPAANIARVTLGYNTPDADGDYTITLTIRRATYDGPLVAQRTITASLTADNKLVTYSFGGVRVPKGSTLTFTQTFSGPGDLNYDDGDHPCAGITETEGTSPPLDTHRRDNVGIVVTAFPVLSNLTITPPKFSTADGTQVGFTLDAPATVRFSVRRLRAGRRVNGKCVKPTPQNAGAKKCTRRLTLPPPFERHAKAGAHSFHYRGRVGGKPLKPGRYELVARPRDATGTGAAAVKRFRIVKS